MKMNKLLGNYDEYGRNAWLYPAVVVVTPLIPSAMLAGFKPSFSHLVPLLFGAGMLFFAAHIVRSLGKKLEKKLIAKWDGLPTTRLLRYRGTSNLALVKRRRAALEKVSAVKFPGKVKEKNNPEGADEEYVSAIRKLIPRVRDDKDKYPLVHQENISYGFRRNLLALKGIAITLLVLLAAVDIAVIFFSGPSVMAGVVFSTHLLIFASWVFIVNDEWVFQAGLSYSERLFEALDSMADEKH